jgi:hypothetical protein
LRFLILVDDPTLLGQVTDFYARTLQELRKLKEGHGSARSVAGHWGAGEEAVRERRGTCSCPVLSG